VSRRLLALGALVVLAVVAAGCGDSPQALDPYLGAWQRVEGGEPNPFFTLTVTASGSGAEVTLVNDTNGVSGTSAGVVHDGFISFWIADADVGPLTSPLPRPSAPPTVTATPPPSEYRLSLDEGGQLVIDLVLADGTLEPVWVYDRASASVPTEP
jgi:hypothetical protein